MNRPSTTTRPRPSPEKGITGIRVRGYKSLGQAQSIEIRPLTVLAGANSSGKSSVMQPLLLMKQTLEASYDPGALLLDGPNVKFTSSDQLLSRPAKSRPSNTFTAGLDLGASSGFETAFTREPHKGFSISKTEYRQRGKGLVVRPGMTHEEIRGTIGYSTELLKAFQGRPLAFSVARYRCFLQFRMRIGREGGGDDSSLVFAAGPDGVPDLERHITQVIHLPGLRGNPARDYPVSAVGASFPGTFEKYVASVIAQWQTNKQAETLDRLCADLKHLGLTWKVAARPIDETRVELQVGRLPKPARGGARDWVSLADVGFGVSQALPVLVALHAARPGQLVYLEQPEIHLHPRAQAAMARVIANAAIRGVRVVVETHSDLLLLGIRTLVAEGVLPAGLVKLHWFQRSEDGSSSIRSADLDESGSFGDWPEDFAEVSLDVQGRFLDAAESRLGVG